MIQTDRRAPKLSLDVLGGLDLRCDGERLSDLLAQPKRVAVLVYLALRRADGVVRRDELLGVFWPESTERRARASLRQTLRFLRGHLGADVLVNRGDAAVRIDLDRVACDVVAFRQAMDAGDDLEALEWYSGELLPGFSVSGAWEFERWLHGERQRLRNDAVQIALRAAKGAAEMGDLARAAAHARWALEQEPLDEVVARWLISLLARSGNRSGAVAVFEALEARLARELELEPSEETRRLVDEIRTGQAPSTGDRDEALGRRGAASPRRILVAALDTLDPDDRLGHLGRLAADTVAQGLASVAELEVVPSLALGPGGDGVNAIEEVARRAGAGTLVSGTLMADGDELRASVRIADLVRGRLLEPPPAVVGRLSDPLPALEELRDRTTRILAPALTKRAVHVKEAVAPPSLDAYRAYMDGLESFTRGAWHDALARFTEAVLEEPRYTLPRIVSAIALWNLGRLEEAEAATRQARAMTEGLGRFERAVLDGVVAWLEGDWAAAHRAARIQAEMAPGSIPHFQVAEEARRLNRPREARGVLSLLEPESGELRGWIYYWIELTTANHLVGDHVRELEIAGRARGFYPDDPAATLMEIRALAALGRADDVTRVLDGALARPATRSPTPGALLREAALELRAHGATAARTPTVEAEGLSRELLHRSAEWYRERVGPTSPDSARRELARTLYLAGHLEEARELFRELVDPGAGVRTLDLHHGHLQAHLDQGYLAVIATRLGEVDAEARWCRCLEELDRPFMYGAQHLWLAAVSSVKGERERAVRWLRRALAQGMPHELFLHSDPHFLGLRGYQSFDRLLRSRG